MDGVVLSTAAVIAAFPDFELLAASMLKIQLIWNLGDWMEGWLAGGAVGPGGFHG